MVGAHGRIIPWLYGTTVRYRPVVSTVLVLVQLFEIHILQESVVPPRYRNTVQNESTELENCAVHTIPDSQTTKIGWSSPGLSSQLISEILTAVPPGTEKKKCKGIYHVRDPAVSYPTDPHTICNFSQIVRKITRDLYDLGSGYPQKCHMMYDSWVMVSLPNKSKNTHGSNNSRGRIV